MTTRAPSREYVEINKASRTLRALAEAASPDLWAKAYDAAKRTDDPDAAFVAAMTPDVAIAACEFLEAVAVWDEEHSTGLTWSHEVPARALRIAEAVNGGDR